MKNDKDKLSENVFSSILSKFSFEEFGFFSMILLGSITVTYLLIFW